MAKNELMVQSISPNGKLEAFVELTTDVAYFYVRDLTGRRPLRSCWVRNFSPAPDELNMDRMMQGLSPMLPADCARYPEGRPVLHDGDLAVVWFEEENGASLLENDQVLCVIPPDSGRDGFEGYAAECSKTSVLCWPLADEKELLKRVQSDRRFWNSWESGEETPYDYVRKQAIGTIMRTLGVTPGVFSTDEGEWPPKGLAKADLDERCVLLTIGGSVRRQPGEGDDPRSAPHRFELAAALPKGAGPEAESLLSNFMISLLEYPWERDASLVDGELVKFSGFLGACDDVAGAMLAKDYPKAPRLDLGRMGSEPVEIYWVLPISAAEWTYAETHGPIELTAKLIEGGVGYQVAPRKSVV